MIFRLPMTRSPKGTIKIEADRGWLRLRWSFKGRRFAMAMGLPDDPTNRAIAQRKVLIIQADMNLDQFDETLERYKSKLMAAGSQVTAVELYEKFVSYKTKQVSRPTLAKYQGMMGHLKRFFRTQSAEIPQDRAFEFRDYLLTLVQPVTVFERLAFLRACWQWGKEEGLVRTNPWVKVTVKVPPKQRPRPFSKSECDRILAGFREDSTYSYYADFVECLLALGCRIGELAGLKWGHLSEDCSSIWIGESWSRGIQKPTKTNKARQFKLSTRIQLLLGNRRGNSCQLTDYIFTTPQGNPIDDHNFRNRAWKSVLLRVGVEYRMPRNSRHSFISRAIADGCNPAQVAEIVGNSPKTLMQNYLGVAGGVELPELWD